MTTSNKGMWLMLPLCAVLVFMVITKVQDQSRITECEKQLDVFREYYAKMEKWAAQQERRVIESDERYQREHNHRVEDWVLQRFH